MVDKSLVDGGFWERATFTVPVTTSDERVKLVEAKYMRRAGEVFEKEGFTVIKMLKPQATLRRPVSGRRRYDIFAFLRRTPVEIVSTVPDEIVPELLKSGYKEKRKRLWAL